MLGQKARIESIKKRLHNLKSNGKNFDSPGVVKKLTRQLRNIETKGER